MNEVLQGLLNEHLYMFAVIVTICMGSMIIAMTCDLVCGIKKAVENHEATTSRGLKKTCSKAVKYFSPFMIAVCIDVIASCAGLPFPIFCMLWAGYCDFCEFISVREKAWQKAEIRKQERTMRIVIENKDDIAKLFSELLTEREKENGRQQ